MKNITKSLAILAIVTLSFGSFQGVIAAEGKPETEEKTTNAPVEKKAEPEVKVEEKATETKAEVKKEEIKKEGKTDAKVEPAKPNTTNALATGVEKKNKAKKVDVKLTETENGYKAELDGVTDAQGNWKIFLNGKQVNSGKGGSSYEFEISDEVMGKALMSKPNISSYTIVAQFEGASQGSPVKGMITTEFTILGIDTKAVVKNGNLSFAVKLNDGKQAKGTWYVVGSKEKQFDPEKADKSSVFAKEVQGGLSQNIEFKNVKLGHYYVLIAFEGIVDGEEASAFTMVEVDVKKDGSASTLKPLPIAKPATKKEVKKAIKDAKGGKLPKTATEYPIAIIASAAALMIGAGILIARRRKQAQ